MPAYQCQLGVCLGSTLSGVRWSLAACALVLVGCQQLTPPTHPTALPGPVPVGAPEGPITIAGEQWLPCTRKQLRAYPPVLDRLATTYYAGPWCLGTEAGNRFMWVYAEPLFDGEDPQRIRSYVNTDAGLLVRGLRTTGYQMVTASPKDTDVGYTARRPSSPNVVAIEVLGESPPPQGQAYEGVDPLRVVVEVRKAGPEDTPAPTP